MRANEFYPMFGLLGLFWHILCIFGENLVIFRAPRKWVTAVGHHLASGTRIWGGILTVGSLGGTNMHSVGRLRDLLWPWYPQLHICTRTLKVPQNDRVFTKIHQNSQNTPKTPQKAKNRVKFVCPSPNRLEVRFLGHGFGKMCPKTEL